MLSEKIIVVIGGAGLLGEVFVTSLIENNATIVIADININKCKQIAAKILQTYDKEIVSIGVNINTIESVQLLISSVSEKFGHIDAVVNTAYPRNKNYGRKFEEVSYSDFCENINLNLGGYFLVAQQFAEFFKKQGYGNIINISSIYGNIAPRFQVYENTNMTMPVEYAAVKAGLNHLTRYIAKYYKGHNIRVNTISPGGIFDSQPEMFLSEYKKFALNKGMLDKEDISGTLIYLLSDMSKYVNGQNIIVDDGWTL